MVSVSSCFSDPSSARWPYDNVDETSLSSKEKVLMRNRKAFDSLSVTGKGKYIVKIRIM